MSIKNMIWLVASICFAAISIGTITANPKAGVAMLFLLAMIELMYSDILYTQGKINLIARKLGINEIDILDAGREECGLEEKKGCGDDNGLE